MKVMRIRAEKRNHQYKASGYCTEDAIEEFKAELKGSYEKPLIYTIYDMKMEADENGDGSILCYTKDGYKWDFRVNG